MSNPFIGEIRMFGGNFAPRGWALCDGQVLPISENTALFSILGTTYGGDGRTTFHLPDLRGRAPMHTGTGPGLTPRPLGAPIGAESVTLTMAQMQAHTHGLPVQSGAGTTDDPAGGVIAGNPADDHFGDPGTTVNLSGEALGFARGAGDRAHNNVQPSLAIGFIIALQGTFPPRN